MFRERRFVRIVDCQDGLRIVVDGRSSRDVGSTRAGLADVGLGRRSAVLGSLVVGVGVKRSRGLSAWAVNASLNKYEKQKKKDQNL